jgi:cell division septation protein DedD
MRSSGKRGGAGERVLEGRHVIGLFMLMLLFSGVFFTLGYVMGRNQYDGQVRAASNDRGFDPPDVLPRNEIATKSQNKKPVTAEPAADSGAPASSDWEFYHAGDSSKPDDHLRPVTTPASTSAITRSTSVAGARGNSASNSTPKANLGPALGTGGGTNLQVAALRRENDAMALANTLRKRNFPTFVQPPQGDKYYHVLVGPYVDQKSLDNARKGLELAGFKAIVKH